MKYRVGIVTLYGDYNYGNRLQNYAIQKILQDKGCSVSTIHCQRSGVKKTLRKLYKSLSMHLLHSKYEVRRKSAFRLFNENEIQTLRISTRNGLIPKSVDASFDFFVVGSDQVWNPNIRKDQRENFFLRFTSKEKRICLSPSIGVTSIDKGTKYTFSKDLEGFLFLSCREEDGAHIIENLTGRKCEHLIDPTLALDEKEWRKFSEVIKIPNKYIISFFLGKISAPLKKQIQDYATNNEAELIDLSDTNSYYYSLGPKQFVYLIDHSSVVFTDSFHVTAFSINMKKDFYVFNRHNNLGDVDTINSRIISLVDMFDLKDRYLGDQTQIPKNKYCDFSRVDTVLETEREKFNAYLERCFSQKQKSPYAFLPEIDCTGCGCCVEKCPSKCLVMKHDAEGFKRPIVLDCDKCISCKKCIDNCPVLQKPYREKKGGTAYASWNLDGKKLEFSSSGATFPALANYVIASGGVVYGAAFQDGITKHIRAVDSNDIIKLCGAKYMQSEHDGIYTSVKNDLEIKSIVLFSGTPCEVAGLYGFLGREYENLITVDFVCHGCPSNLIWQKYIDFVQKRYLHDEQIDQVNFRYKKDGWEHYSFYAKSDNYEFTEDRYNNPYLKAFIGNLDLRESCYHCRFKGVERISDFTLGDFWGIQNIAPDKMNERGTSLAIIHTDKAYAIWAYVKDQLQCYNIAFEDFVGKSNNALIRSVQPHKNRSLFFSEIIFGQSNFEETVTRLLVTNKYNYIKKFKRKMLRKFHSLSKSSN